MKTPTTPARQEGSATFSLGELMKLENERVAEQQRDRAAEAKAAVDAEAQKHAAAEADSARKRKAELDDVARREAIQRAVVEQARLEVDARTRAEERERERRHELELAAARNALPPPKSTTLGALAGATGFGGILMLAVVMAIHFGVEKPATDRQIAELQLREGTADQRATNAEQKIAQQDRMIAALEKNKNALEAQIGLANPPAAPVPAKTASGPKLPPIPAKKIPPKPDCDRLDPMCF